MCLITKSKDYKIAEEDIVCYKVLDKEFNSLNGLHRYTIGEENPYKDMELWNFNSLEPSWYIECGYHSFNNYDDVCTLYRRHIIITDYMIVKCVIPKGTRYYEGKHTYPWGPTGYVSENIIVTCVL